MFPRRLGSWRIPSDPLLHSEQDGEYFTISPDGQYAFIQRLSYDSTLYDIQHETIVQQFPNIKFFTRLVWSSDARQFAYYNRPTSEDDEEHGIYVYDIEQDRTTLRENTQFSTDTMTFLSQVGWSPNNRYLAFSQSVGLYQQPPAPLYVRIYDFSTTEIIDTCLISTSVDFFLRASTLMWSRDGRYLALDGKVTVMATPKEERIYIYDVVEQRIFELPGEHAEIIGWTSFP